MAKVDKKVNELNPKAMVSKDNDIVQVKNTVARRDPLTLTQQKIILCAASLVKPEDTALTEYVIDVKDFFSLCDVSRTSAYSDVCRELRNIRPKGIELLEVNAKTNETERVFAPFFASIRYRPRKGEIIFSIPKDLLPYYQNRNREFTLIELGQACILKGHYSVLFYEIMRSWAGKREIYLTIGEVRRQLEITDNQYKLHADFMRRVIGPSVEEINIKTSMKISFIEKKGKRNKVEGLKFVIEQVKSLEEPDKEKSDLANMLVSLGIEQAAAWQIVNTYSKKRVLENVKEIKKIPKDRIERLPALICAAIRDDYARIEQQSMFAEREPIKEILEASESIAATNESVDIEDLAPEFKAMYEKFRKLRKISEGESA